ncbi:MAG TPA: alpha-1,2-fucosyltransferase [Caulobacteraceae bacterium]
MKTVKVQGGLGNQLFCLAFAHSIATLTGRRTGLDIASFGADRYGHGFELAELVEAIGDLEVVRRPLLGHRIAGRMMAMLPFLGFVAEGKAPSDRPALEALVASGAYFSGYWQDEAYFANAARIRELFGAFLGRRGGPQASHDVVIHHRTYKEEVRPERRGAPGADYVERALALIERRGGAARDVLLISDDTALAMERLGSLAARVQAPSSPGPFADMALMIGARSLVLSNSSFSWWGGFCGEARSIVYPKPAGLFHYPAPARNFLLA